MAGLGSGPVTKHVLKMDHCLCVSLRKAPWVAYSASPRTLLQPFKEASPDCLFLHYTDPRFSLVDCWLTVNHWAANTAPLPLELGSRWSWLPSFCEFCRCHVLLFACFCIAPLVQGDGSTAKTMAGRNAHPSWRRCESRVPGLTHSCSNLCTHM